MVAADLKAANLASADQYLNELKLMHVEEAGFSLEAWLARTFQLCKKSASRHRGPVKRALEVTLDEAELQVIPDSTGVAVPLAAWAYAWGGHLLQEIELSRVRWNHVSWNVARKTVKLYTPHSKCDQMGLGVARALQCCGESPCWVGCAWMQIQRLRQNRGRAGGHLDGPLFPNKDGNAPSKTEMVSSWKAILDPNMTGHSAWRSGAMAYVRKGMEIKDLACLGRWKSSVVLSYAEEALETMPVNCRLQRGGGQSLTSRRSSNQVVVSSVLKTKKTQEPTVAHAGVCGRPKPVEL